MSKLKHKAAIVLLLIPVWIMIYIYLQDMADFIALQVFRMTPGKHLTETMRFFIYAVPKILMLLMLIIFVVGIIRTYFSPEKTKKALDRQV